MIKLTFLIQCQKRFITPKILSRTLNTGGYKESFQYKILDYFENAIIVQKVIHRYVAPTQIKENTLNNKDLKHMTAVNLIKLNSIYQDIHNFSNITDQLVREELLKDIDEKCCSTVSFLSHIEILGLLVALLKILPGKLITTCIYDKSLSILLDSAEKGLLTKHELVQFLFFISLQKEKGADYVKGLQHYLTDISDLSLIDKCITVQSFIKTSIRIPPDQVILLEEIMEKHFEQLIEDPNLLVTIGKAVMINNTSKDFCLKSLSRAIIKYKKPLDFKRTVCILSLYAEALVFNSDVMHKLLTNCMNIIEKDVGSKEHILNIKEVDTFLWSISNLNLTLTANQRLLLKTLMEERFSEFRKFNNLGLLVNSFLCLHLLRCWNRKLINKCLQDNILSQISNNEKFHWKVKSRLQLLKSQLMLELHYRIPENTIHQVQIGYTPSENLKLVQKVAASLVNRGLLSNVIIECPIVGLIIPGVTLYTENQKYHIDILDNLTCLRDTFVPYGLMNLKIRLLPLVNLKQLIIYGDIFKDDSAELAIETKILTFLQLFAGQKIYKI